MGPPWAASTRSTTRRTSSSTSPTPTSPCTASRPRAPSLPSTFRRILVDLFRIWRNHKKKAQILVSDSEHNHNNSYILQKNKENQKIVIKYFCIIHYPDISLMEMATKFVPVLFRARTAPSGFKLVEDKKIVLSSIVLWR